MFDQKSINDKRINFKQYLDISVIKYGFPYTFNFFKCYVGLYKLVIFVIWHICTKRKICTTIRRRIPLSAASSATVDDYCFTPKFDLDLIN